MHHFLKLFLNIIQKSFLLRTKSEKKPEINLSKKSQKKVKKSLAMGGGFVITILATSQKDICSETS